MVDFDLVGGEDVVRSHLEPDEAITGACEGKIEQNSTVAHPGRGKKGILAITNKRVVVFLSPGRLFKNPQPVSAPLDRVDDAGTHRGLDFVLIVMAPRSSAGSYYFHVANDDIDRAELMRFAIRSAAGLN